MEKNFGLPHLNALVLFFTYYLPANRSQQIFTKLLTVRPTDFGSGNERQFFAVVSIHDEPVAEVEVIEEQSNGIPCSANFHCHKYTPVMKLLRDARFVKSDNILLRIFVTGFQLLRYFNVSGFDTADIEGRSGS